jgi:hypothetical protein
MQDVNDTNKIYCMCIKISHVQFKEKENIKMEVKRTAFIHSSNSIRVGLCHTTSLCPIP